MQITQHSIASIEFILTDDEGRVIDSSENSGPLVYMHGSGSLLPGLQTQLEGKSAGDAFKTRIAPKDAYGERDPKKIQSVPRSHLQEEVEVQLGMQFQAQSIDGMEVMTVVKIEGDTVQMDGNHPFAGVGLNFDMKVLEVREATAEEVEHGHAHGEGEHQH